jgi:hypothetical protein
MGAGACQIESVCLRTGRPRSYSRNRWSRVCCRSPPGLSSPSPLFFHIHAAERSFSIVQRAAFRVSGVGLRVSGVGFGVSGCTSSAVVDWPVARRPHAHACIPHTRAQLPRLPHLPARAPPAPCLTSLTCLSHRAPRQLLTVIGSNLCVGGGWSERDPQVWLGSDMCRIESHTSEEELVCRVPLAAGAGLPVTIHGNGVEG